jgi:5-formyltetrahydrofolate cyclo-ligase
MTKKELRSIYRQKRMQFTSSEKMKLDDLLLIQLQQQPLPAIQTLFCYWPIEQYNEPDTQLFCDFLEFRNPGLIITYPVVDAEKSNMKAVIINEETLFERKAFNVMEPKGTQILNPEEIDLVFVPLLCFDTKGFRIGYGKGYYDRFLAACSKDCLKIGFSYFAPVEEIPDKHDFDVPLDLCVTPQTIYVF